MTRTIFLLQSLLLLLSVQSLRGFQVGRWVSSPTLNPSLILSRVSRGGARAHDDDLGGDAYDDDYDQDVYDEDDGDEEEEISDSRRPLPFQKSTATKTTRMPQRDLAASFKENRLFPSKKQPKSSSNSHHWTKQIASSTWKLGRSLAVGSVQQTTRLAYQLVRPRKVQPQELNGLWRLDQQITLPKGRDVASVATIQLNARSQTVSVTVPIQGNLTRNTTTPATTTSITTLSTETISAPYSLDKTRWKSFRTEFVLPAFSIRGGRPRLYGYRGYWQRKLADPTVIKLVGKIHIVHKQRTIGRGVGRGTEYVFGQAIGTFVARRRLRLLPSDRVKEEGGGGTMQEDDDNDDDEDDAYDGEDDPFQNEGEDQFEDDDEDDDDWDETEMDDE